MADVTTTFGAKDVGVAATIQRLQGKLAAFQASMTGVSNSAKKMQGSFSGLGRSIVGLAAAYVGVTQAIAAFNKAMDFGGRMNDLSEITGESAGNLAVLERAFDNTGVGGEKMMPMLGKMTEFIQNLEKGQEGAVATANKLGISFADLKNKTPIERFQMLLRAVAGLTTENDRLNASQDIFGTRMGGRLIPLINNFSTEMASAAKQLGSVVEILNRNSAGIDEFGDRVQKAIGAKPMEFMIGVLDEMTGRTGDLAKAISELDAAGFGKQLAQIVAGISQDPGGGFLLFGEMLLLAVKNAGNAMVNAMVFAADVYKAAMSNPDTFKGMLDGLLAGFQMIFNFAARMVQTITKTFVQGLAGIASLLPIIGKALAADIAGPIASIEKLQAETAKQGDALRQRMGSAMGPIGADILEQARTMPRSNADFFGAGQQDAEVKALTSRLTQLGTPDSKSDQFFKQINQIYADEVEGLFAAIKDRDEQVRRLETLRSQYREAALQGIKAFGEPSANLAPPQAQMQQNAMPQAAREDMARQASATPTTAQEEVASEPTLRRAVELLESLNTKLPQPVLV